MTYELEPVWPSPSREVRDDVVEFWFAENAIPDLPLAEERAHQLIVVARADDGRVAGVSTGFITFIDRLGFECVYYRTFVGHGHRVVGLHSTGLVWQILRESYKLLNQRFLAGHNPNALGLYMEIENPSIMKARNDLIWSENGMNVVYLGHDPSGLHFRAWYFAGARLT